MIDNRISGLTPNTNAMPKFSQYLEPYLDINEVAGYGQGITPGSYLMAVLKGSAKLEWSNRYRKSLINSLKRFGAVKGPSKLGKIAYYRSK